MQCIYKRKQIELKIKEIYRLFGTNIFFRVIIQIWIYDLDSRTLRLREEDDHIETYEWSQTSNYLSNYTLHNESRDRSKNVIEVQFFWRRIKTHSNSETQNQYLLI